MQCWQSSDMVAKGAENGVGKGVSGKGGGCGRFNEPTRAGGKANKQTSQAK